MIGIFYRPAPQAEPVPVKGYQFRDRRPEQLLTLLCLHADRIYGRAWKRDGHRIVGYDQSELLIQATAEAA